jgi:hypothetical protein
VRRAFVPAYTVITDEFNLASTELPRPAWAGRRDEPVFEANR